MINTILLGVTTLEMSIIFSFVMYDQIKTWNNHRKFLKDHKNYKKKNE